MNSYGRLFVSALLAGCVFTYAGMWWYSTSAQDKSQPGKKDDVSSQVKSYIQQFTDWLNQGSVSKEQIFDFSKPYGIMVRVHQVNNSALYPGYENRYVAWVKRIGGSVRRTRLISFGQYPHRQAMFAQWDYGQYDVREYCVSDEKERRRVYFRLIIDSKTPGSYKNAIEIIEAANNILDDPERSLDDYFKLAQSVKHMLESR